VLLAIKIEKLDSYCWLYIDNCWLNYPNHL